MLGLTGDPLNGGPKQHPDYWNVNLTGYATLGKWEVGAIAFGSTDLESLAYGPGTCGVNTLKCEQAQWAAGGLVGYEFPGITVQARFSSDFWTQNYHNINGSESYEKRFWVTTVIPLWTAPKEEALK